MDGEQVAKLRDKEGGWRHVLGPEVSMTLEITQGRAGRGNRYCDPGPCHTIWIALPVNAACISAGLPEETYLSEFQIAEEVPERVKVRESCRCAIHDSSKTYGGRSFKYRGRVGILHDAAMG